MSVPTPEESRDSSGRWAAVRDAIGSNAKTFRFCLIVTVCPAAVAAITELLWHIRLCGLFTAIASDNLG
jgi:hypothetical protein